RRDGGRPRPSPLAPCRWLYFPTTRRDPSMRLRRFIYTLTMYLLTPVILYRLAVRGLHYPDYFARWRERFGFFADPKLRDSIRIHAVSMGEVNAALPLIDALMQRY